MTKMHMFDNGHGSGFAPTHLTADVPDDVALLPSVQIGSKHPICDGTVVSIDLGSGVMCCSHGHSYPVPREYIETRQAGSGLFVLAVVRDGELAALYPFDKGVE